MAQQHYTFMGKEFTLRQMQVLLLTAHGLTRQQVAYYLKILPGTVKTHINTIYDRTGIRSKGLLIAKALTGGCDDRGNHNNEYLFEDMEEVPWQMDPPALPA